MMGKLKQNYSLILFVSSLIIFILFKWEDLKLPFYWDEAWVYGKAARNMADHTISLMPKTLDYEIGRGHPLLFHATFAIFLKLFGNNVLNAHLFALIIFYTLLAIFFFLSEKIIKEKIGWILIIFFLIQPVFVAQSSLVLPEITLTIFTLLTIYAFSNEKKWLLFFSSSLAIMIKESAIVVFILMNIISLLNFYSQKWKAKILISKLSLINLPLVFWLIHILLHKIQFGSFLFHEHANYISFDLCQILQKLERMFLFTFLAQGRNIVFFIFISLLIFSIIKKEYEIFKNKFFKYLLLFIPLFFTFSSVNYYCDRYITVCIFFFLFSFSMAVYYSSITSKMKTAIIVSCIFASVYALITNTSNNDVTPTYTNVIKNHQETINYLTNNLNKNDTIYTWFNMKEEIQNHYCGFVLYDNQFKNLVTNPEANSRYYVFSNIENTEEMNLLSNKLKLIMVKKFEYKQAWACIMKKP